MFEKEISGYAFNITKRYTGDRVKLSTLLSDAELPDDFKKFAEAEVEEILDMEGLGQSKTGKFDLSTPEVQALFKEIHHILKNSYEFPREDFLDLADKASKFVFNYVIRPRWTLEKFLFKGEQQTDKTSIRRASRFFNCYTYYPKGIIEYLEFHGKTTLDIETWKRLHSKIDEHLLSTLPAKLSGLTSGLFSLFEFSSGAQKVPSDAMALFFRDKNAAEIVDRIEFARDVKNIRSLDVMTLAMVLEASSRDVSQDIAVLPRSEEPPKEFRTFERQKVTHPLHPEEPPAREIPDIVMNETPGSPSSPVEESAVTPHMPEMERQRPPEGLKLATPSSIRNFMSAKLEEKIIRKIFHGSRSGYQVALHKIDESANWQTASKIVEGIFIDNDVDPFSKYAVAFTDVVSAKFRSAQTPGKRA
ncbi:MAG: hypothetical protein M1339_02490 [Bacteroidetes bacterium]|nr:hypothetical protein [Bacteroidota bacterium]